MWHTWLFCCRSHLRNLSHLSPKRIGILNHGNISHPRIDSRWRDMKKNMNSLCYKSFQCIEDQCCIFDFFLNIIHSRTFFELLLHRYCNLSLSCRSQRRMWDPCCNECSLSKDSPRNHFLQSSSKLCMNCNRCRLHPHNSYPCIRNCSHRRFLGSGQFLPGHLLHTTYIPNRHHSRKYPCSIFQIGTQSLQGTLRPRTCWLTLDPWCILFNSAQWRN